MTWRTDALEGSFNVLASPTTAEPGSFFTLVDVHADLHDFAAAKSLVAVALESSWSVDAGSIPADSAHDLALVDVVAFEPVFVQSVALVAATAVRPNGVLAPSVQTHPGEFHAFVDVLSVGEALAFRTQFYVLLSALFGTQFALVIAPRSTYRATADTL